MCSTSVPLRQTQGERWKKDPGEGNEGLRANRDEKAAVSGVERLGANGRKSGEDERRRKDQLLRSGLSGDDEDDILLPVH